MNTVLRSLQWLVLLGAGTAFGQLQLPEITLPEGTVDVSYSAKIAATGASPPFTYSIPIGSLPPGLSIDNAGSISGTPLSSGNSTFTVRVTVASLPLVERQYQIRINDKPTITNGMLPTGTVGTAYSAQLTSKDGTGTKTYSLEPVPSLPAGLNLAATGAITGTPTAAGNPIVSFRVTDSLGAFTIKQFELRVNPGAGGSTGLTITTTALPPWTVNRPYTTTLAATGGTGTLRWDITSGSLPSGLSLSAAGVLSGTTAVAGSFPVTFRVQDDSSTPATKSLTLTMNVEPSITTASLPNGAIGTAYNQTILTTGGTPPFMFTRSGVLPAGLDLSSAGVLSGTPTAGGTFNITVTVTDAAGAIRNRDYSFVISSPLSISTSTVPNGVINTPYPATTLTATGGTGSGYGWSLIGAGLLPLGMQLSPGGVLSGTPTQSGTFNITVRVTDSGSNSADRPFSFTIAAAALTITTASPLPEAVLNQAYNQTITAAGGSGGGYSFAVTAGSPPVGISLASNGQLTGTPTATGTANFTVRVRDSANSETTKAFVLVVVASPLTITTDSPLPNATIGSNYTTTLAASGGAGGPYSFTMESGVLPPGLTLASNGSISGTPTGTAGTATFMVKVTDSGSGTATKSFSLTTLAAALNITTSSLPNATVGASYTTTLQATGGTTPYSWSITAGKPAGLDINASTGVFSGTPQAAATGNVTFQVRDANNVAVTRQLSLTVVQGLSITTTALPPGSVGTFYSQTLQASGGSGQYLWSVTNGAIPPGIRLAGGTGILSGTPETTIGSPFEFVVQVRDSTSGATATQPLSIIIAPALTISTTSVPSATAGTPYAATLEATGGNPPYTWTLASGSLPAGLTVQSTGQIAGTTNQTGSFNATVRVTDSAGASATRALTIAVTGSDPLRITTASLPNGTVGVGYSATLSASGGSGAGYSWTLTAGPLPAGLSLSTGGSITGTPSAAGTANFTVRLTDSLNASTERPLSIVVQQASSSLQVLTQTLPNGTVGTPYGPVTLTATGGSGAGYVWTLEAGTALPAGLTFSSSGSVSGTPSAAGTFSPRFRVTDSQNNTALSPAYSLTIAAATPLQVTTTNLPSGVVNTAYSAQLAAQGGTGTGYSWTIASGTLPAGLGLAPATGVISGTPTSAGSSALQFRVTDSGNNTATSASLTVAITAGGLSIVNPALPNAGLNSQYTATLTASGGSPPYTWTVSQGSLPPGLALSQTGVISGAPTAAGTAMFVIRVQDGTGATATRQFSLAVSAATLSITTVALPVSSVGAVYNVTLVASGGATPYTWSIRDGSLPPGIGLTTATGQLSGTPTVPGLYNFTAQVLDSASVNATRAFSLQVNPGLTVTTNALPGGSLGVAYNGTLAASGGSGAGYSWSIASGTLPAGLTLSTTGVISGTPVSNGTSTFTVQVGDSSGSTASRQLSITVGITLSITTSALPNAATNVPYSGTLTAAGGTPPLQWSIATGSLPAGLALNTSTGAITGTAASTGTSTFTARVQDSAGASATRQLSLTVAEGLVITTGNPLPAASEGVAYAASLNAIGGAAPYTWSVSVGSLPPGLSLGTATGQISGTPTTAGNYSFIVQAVDAAQQPTQKAFTLVVAGRVTIVTPSLLPQAPVLQPYSETLQAQGGAPPYSWTLAAGSPPLPIGMNLDSNGTLSGTPTSAGVFPFSLQVSDSQGNTATRQFSLQVVLGLSVTTSSTLPGAIAGQAYAQPLTAVGGQPPYVWTITSGSLAAGLSLSAGGIISGSPTATGTFTFTVQVTDNLRASTTATFSLIVRLPGNPLLTITGPGETVEPAQQPRLNLALGAPYPAALSGTVTLAFTPDAAVPVDDPAVVFANGRRTMNFTVDPNSTAVQFPESSAFQTGTVAGTLTFTIALRSGTQDVTPSPPPQQVSKMNRSAPVIRRVTARRVSGGLEVELVGYSTSRELTQGVFRFSPVPGSSLQTTELTVPLSDGARTWYQNEQSRQFGSQFTLTQQFNVQGDTSSIGSVTVVLTNAAGSSQAVTANLN